MAQARPQSEPTSSPATKWGETFKPRTKPPADESPPTDEPPADENGDDEPGFWQKLLTTRNVLIGSGVVLVGFFWWRKKESEEEGSVDDCPACTLAGFKEAFAKAQQARGVGNCDQALSSLVEAGAIGGDYEELAGQVVQEVAELKKSCFRSNS